MSSSDPRHTPALLRFGVVPLAVAAALAGAVWLAAGRLAPSSRTAAIAAGVVAFALVAFAVGRLARRRPDLRWPVRVAVWATALLSAGAFYATSVRDTVVDERVAVAAAAPAAAPAPAPARSPASRPAAMPPPAAAPAPAPAPVNVALRAGAVRGADGHAGSGTARVIRLAEGGRVLTLTSFDTDPGPDVLVYLTPDEGTSGGDIVDLGHLRGSRGDQQYAIPASVDLGRHDTLVIWCRAFSVRIAVADLAPA